MFSSSFILTRLSSVFKISSFKFSVKTSFVLVADFFVFLVFVFFLAFLLLDESVFSLNSSVPNLGDIFLL